MSSEWTFSELGKEAINASRSFAFNEYPRVVFVNTGDVLEGKFLHSTISDSKSLPGQAKKAIRKNDILLSEIRPGNGRHAFVDFEVDNVVVSTKFMVIESLGRVLPRFLYYVITSQAALHEFQRIAESRSGTFPQITFDSIAHFPIPAPPIEEQMQLVTLFGALEDRISLLRETNVTLESIAQCLFKSWFVDFDPVRAKQEGRAPDGIDEAAAALFPDGFEESESGLVPRGWKYRPVREVVEHIFDGPHATPPEATEGAVFLGIKNLTGSSLDLAEVRFIAEEDWERWTKRVTPAHGDIVFSYEATLGFFALLPPDLRCCLGRRLALIRPKTNEGCGHFWFHQFVSRPFQQLLEKHTVHGATVNRIALKEFPSFKVLVPPINLQVAFDGIAGPLWSKIHANQSQVQSLVALRDTLLPRLISGQLRLPEAKALAA